MTQDRLTITATPKTVGHWELDNGLMIRPVPLLVPLLTAFCCNTLKASVVIFAFANDFVMVAADSREMLSDGTFRDTACKIGTYGNRIVFTHVGVSSFDVTDFMAEAKRSSIEASKNKSSDSIAKRASVLWLTRAEELLRRNSFQPVNIWPQSLQRNRSNL